MVGTTQMVSPLDVGLLLDAVEVLIQPIEQIGYQLLGVMLLVPLKLRLEFSYSPFK
jgi:hypothetical protein